MTESDTGMWNRRTGWMTGTARKLPRLFKGSKRGQNKVHRLAIVGNERAMGRIGIPI